MISIRVRFYRQVGEIAALDDLSWSMRRGILVANISDTQGYDETLRLYSERDSLGYIGH